MVASVGVVVGSAIDSFSEPPVAGRSIQVASLPSANAQCFVAFTRVKLSGVGSPSGSISSVPAQAIEQINNGKSRCLLICTIRPSLLPEYAYEPYLH